MGGSDSGSSGGSEGEPVYYTSRIAFIYIFNLIVGAGALALPRAFAETGWVLGMLAISVLALMSYCTSTFMVEAMSIANGLTKLHTPRVPRRRTAPETYGSTGVDQGNYDNDKRLLENATTVEENNLSVGTIMPTDADPLLNDDDDLYVITRKFEMGEMARVFFHKVGLIIYYIIISLYLYGDLAIYAAAIPKSLTTTICGDNRVFEHDATKEPCVNVSSGIRVIDMYHTTLAVFVLTVCPFVFFNIGKTKFLQIFTTLFRWFSFAFMVVLAALRIIRHEGNPTPTWFRIGKLPDFFGVAVYSYMCQHSLPSILTPVRNKRRVNGVILLDFVSVSSFYSLLALTAVFAFPTDELQDLYTLNFSTPPFFKYFLQLFPVFTLSTSFPIIAITLRENLRTLFLHEDKEYNLAVRRILFPLLTLIPPITIAYCTYDVGMLVNITGTYAGAVIQYIIPVLLVYFGRRQVVETIGTYQNKYMSPFKHSAWIYFVVVWYGLCFVFCTVNTIAKQAQK